MNAFGDTEHSQPRPLSNLFLDFINPESRRLSMMYRNFLVEQHVSYLCGLLNLYALWCGSYCILPPSVSMECVIADAALNKKILYLKQRIIRAPLNELSIEDFEENRRYEHKPFRMYYADMFASHRKHILTRAPEAIIEKPKKTGLGIVRRWEEFADSKFKLELPDWVTPKDVDSIARVATIPVRMIERGDIVTWPAFRAELESQGLFDEKGVKRKWLQHLYFVSHIEAGALRTITRLPGQLAQIGYVKHDPGYDYEIISHVLDMWGLAAWTQSADAQEIIALRRTAGFSSFRMSFDGIATWGAGRPEAIRRVFIAAHSAIGEARNLSIVKLLQARKAKSAHRRYQELGDLLQAVGDAAHAQVAAWEAQKTWASYAQGRALSPKPSVEDKPMNKKTVVELDLVAYSSVSRLIEDQLDVTVVAHLNQQIQALIDTALLATPLRREEALLGTTGDGAILAFETAADAHNFAVALHNAADAHNRDRATEASHRWFRVGAATGEIYLRIMPDGRRDIAGTVIADAVRLEAAAHPGEFLIDSVTYELLPDYLQAMYSSEENVAGKRNEIYRARRFCVISRSKEPEVSVESVLALFGRLNPRDQADRIMIRLGIPADHRPPNTIELSQRTNKIVEWASLCGSATMKKLHSILLELL